MSAALRSATPVTLVGGGPFAPRDLEDALALAPTLAAADAGADQALALGRMPQAVFGDFDSISRTARTAIPAERLHRIAEQDSTDIEKALTRIDAPLVLGVGFSGGRQDHVLAALNALARRIGPPCILLSDQDVITLAPAQLSLDLPPDTRLSLMPMGPATGRSTGLEWPIDGLDFAPDGRIGTSNRSTGPVELSIEGPMLLILPRPQLALLAQSLLRA
ncbi:thiamine diphosphokinase [Paracoccus sulfuroxidans]|uniref:Thiamine diphosphokinase n=1 Tax=Paracoccus sulfuroxidans TaxID=384678 RepID=A0A562NSA5_9RHOB|nr:thiamine diphosphokinase [Paracoccus sulfuroxidans]TWI35003.1 thiamine pyrophosphokinase [Paracoccus sulfuroxidans]